MGASGVRLEEADPAACRHHRLLSFVIRMGRELRVHKAGDSDHMVSPPPPFPLDPARPPPIPCDPVQPPSPAVHPHALIKGQCNSYSRKMPCGASWRSVRGALGTFFTFGRSYKGWLCR